MSKNVAVEEEIAKRQIAFFTIRIQIEREMIGSSQHHLEAPIVEKMKISMHFIQFLITAKNPTFAAENFNWIFSVKILMKSFVTKCAIIVAKALKQQIEI